MKKVIATQVPKHNHLRREAESGKDAAPRRLMEQWNLDRIDGIRRKDIERLVVMHKGRRMLPVIGEDAK